MSAHSLSAFKATGESVGVAIGLAVTISYKTGSTVRIDMLQHSV